jgi:hypothetical protein
MEKMKDGLTLLGWGILIGVIVTIILIFIIEAKPSNVSFGGVDFDFPTTAATVSTTQSSNNSSATSTPTLDSTVSNTNTQSTECNPPTDLGLRHLSNFTNPVWSVGIWGSENMLNFISPDERAGIIDTDDTDFGEFQIWISPCYTQYHGYSDGVRFWPLQKGVQSTGTPIILGQITTISLPPKSGFWGLGDQFKP